MRIGAPVVLASLAIGCNAVLDWSELHKTPAGETQPDDDDGNGDDDDDTSSSSSSTSGTASSSGQPKPPACDPTKPFGAPVAVTGKVNTSAHETAPSLTADELTMFFQRTAGLDGGAILVARRATINDSWGEPEELTELQQNGVDYSPTVTGDGLTLFWSELTTASPRHQVIKTAVRTTPSAKFGSVRVLDEVSNTTMDDGAPSIAQDGSELFFTSDRQGGARKLFRSVRGVDGFGAASLVSELVSGSAVDTQSALSVDGLTLFFGSDRTGGKGDSDVWVAKRASRTAAFGDVKNLEGPVNTADAEWPTWISPDGCRLYLGLLKGGAGDILVAVRP